MMLFSLVAWADEVTFVASDFTPVESSDYSTTKNGITVSVVGSTVTADQMRIFKGKTITISSTVGNITKIVFTCTAKNDAKYGPGSFGDLSGYTYADEIGTWEGSASEVTFTSEKNQVRATQIVVTVGGEPSTQTATTIEFAEGYETRATCGKDEKLALPTATVKAGDAAVTGATVSWTSSNEELAKIQGNDIVIPNGVQGEATIKAEYAGNDSYKASSKSYKVTVYKGATLLSTLVSDVTSTNEKWDNGGEYVSYWFVDMENGMKSVSNTVTYANGKYIYLTDGTNNLLFYGNNTLELKQGDVVSGDLGEGKQGAVWGKLYRYNKLPEFSFTDMNIKVQSEGAAVQPKTITVDQLSENLNGYVKIDNAAFVAADGKNVSFTVGEAPLAIYNQFNVGVEGLEAGAAYTLLGMVSVYKENYQLYLISFEKADPAHISDMSAGDNQPEGELYNIAGQRVEKAKKGLYIRDGKKFVNK